VNLFFEVQRKTLCVFASLRANFFFLKKTRSLHTEGRLCVNFFVVWRAKAQRRKEIGKNLSDLPEAGRLFVNLFFEVQRKTLCGLAALRANFFFFAPRRSLR
jgi:hypothetical protein